MYATHRAGERPFKRMLLSGTTGLAMTLFGAASLAQDVDEGVDPDDTIVVEGVRGSLQRAADIKREADFILDALTAEDFGDLPDFSLGDAVVRLPGVTGGFGVGSPESLSIRGFSSEFGLTTVNGRLVTSDRSGRNVRTNLFPSSLISRAAVYKSPSADLIEGGMSGTVEFATVDPLHSIRINDQNTVIRTTGRLGLRGSAENLRDGDEFDTRFDASLRQSIIEDKLAIGLGYSYAAFTDGSETLGARRPQLDGARIIDGFAPITTPLGQVIFDDDGDGSTPDPFENNDALLAPSFISYEIDADDRERHGASFLATYEPTPELKLHVDALLGYETLDQERAALTQQFLGDGISGSVDETGYFVNVLFVNPRLQYEPREREETIETQMVGFNAEWGRGPWTLSGDVFFSKVTLDRDTTEVTIRPGDERPDAFFSSGQRFGAIGVEYLDFDPANPADLAMRQVDLEALDRSDESFSVRFDADREVDFGFVSSVEFGMRYQTREKSVTLDETRFAGSSFRDLFTQEDLEAQRIGFVSDDAYDRFDDASYIPTDWYHLSPFALQDAFLTGLETGLDERISEDALGSSEIFEDTLAAYIKANFGGVAFDLPFSGNVGLRAVQTDLIVKGTGGTFIVTQNDDGTFSFDPENADDELVPLREENDYVDYLPSVNVAVSLTDDLVLRAAASKTIARPRFEALFLDRTISVENELNDEGDPTGVDTLTINGGNPQVEPYESNNFDLSLEWSPNRDTLIAGAVFHKDLDSIVTGGLQGLGAVETEFGTIPVRLNTFINDEPPSSSVTGFEFQAQTVFSFLPEPFDGLGVAVNYTYIDSEITEVINDESLYTIFNEDGTIAGYVENERDNEEGELGGVRQPLSRISENTINAIVYYEYGPFSARTAVRWRDDGFENQPAFLNNLAAEGRTIVDINAGYEINDNFRVIFQGRNITDAYSRSYFFEQTPIVDPVATATFTNLGNDRRLQDLDFSGPTYYIGLNYRY